MATLKYRNSDGTFSFAQTVDVNAIALAGYGYSTTEQCVGCWADGRPLYRKVVNFTTPASGTNTIISLGTDSDIKQYDGYIFDKDGNSVSINYYYDANCFVSTWAKGNSTTSNKYYVRCMTAGYGSCNGYAIVEYTKSTDAENSFTIDKLTTSSLDTTATAAEVSTIYQ